MEARQLFTLLKKARASENIYIIARMVVMLRGQGHCVELSEVEQDSILQCLNNARRGKGILGLESGYELARWILICRHLFPEKEIEPTIDDTCMIQEACDSYCDDRILKQVASLVHMGKVLNITININKLPPKKRKFVEKLAATLK